MAGEPRDSGGWVAASVEEQAPKRPDDRNLALPLVDGPSGELWRPDAAASRHLSVWPALSDALSEVGGHKLWDELRRALEATPGDPERALMVVEAFWRTMRIRRGEDYQQRMTDPEPGRSYRRGELREEIEAELRRRNDP